MSAFSRGLFLRPQCLRATAKSSSHHFFTSPRALITRPFSTSQFLFAKPLKQTTKLRPQTPLPAKRTPLKLAPSASIKAATNSYTTPYSTLEATLAAKPSPTLLYAAPSHSYFIFSAYAIGLSTLAYTAYNLELTVFHPPTDLAVWVKPSFAIICLFTACFGVWFLRAPRRLIKAISAVPTTIPQSASAAARRELKLHIELRKLLPFLGKRYTLVIADPAQCGLNAALTVPKERVEAHQRRLAEVDRAWVEKAKKKSILTLPFRQMSLASHKLFISMGRVWKRDGFLEFYVDKSEYKLDISGGWALEDGKVLDRLVKVRPQV